MTTKVNLKTISKYLIFYEEMVELEGKQGHLVVFDDLKRAVLERAKEMNLSMSERAYSEIYCNMLATGFIFAPKKGFAQRFEIYKRNRLKQRLEELRLKK